jgi:5-formyltetrahydrofolate cyclo-ligase
MPCRRRGDGGRLGKGGGFADLEFTLTAVADLIGPHTVSVTTVHELQVLADGTRPLTSHYVPVDFRKLIFRRSQDLAAALAADEITR